MAGALGSGRNWFRTPITFAEVSVLVNDTQSNACLLPIESWKPRENGRQLRHDVGQALERGERRIVVDCATWEAPDVVLLSALIGCAGLCAEQGAKFELANLDASIVDALHELRLAKRLGLAVEA